jgi:hypothetical protein
LRMPLLPQGRLSVSGSRKLLAAGPAGHRAGAGFPPGLNAPGGRPAGSLVSQPAALTAADLMTTLKGTGHRDYP